MDQKETAKNKAASLRRKAEQLALERSAPAAQAGVTFSPEELQGLVHELQVHQIELEMQNDELRQTHDELAAAQSRYFDLYNLAPVGYLVLNLNGSILQANLTAARLLGTERSRLVNRPFNSFIERNHLLVYRQQFKDLAQIVAPQNCDLVMQRRDGSQFWARMEVSSELNEDGVQVYQVVIIDISDRKQAEENLRENQKNLQTIFDSMSEGLALNELVFDKNGEIIDYRILNASRAFHSVADFKGEQVIGGLASQLYNMSHATINAFWKERRDKHTTTVTEMLSPLNQRWFYVATSPLFENKFVTTFIDITERKQQEAALEQYSNHLEELVLGRTAEMESARNQAEAANHAKDDFLAVMSHEIRTPLNGVLGMAQLLMQTSLTEKQRTYLANLQISGETLMAVINNVLDFSKIESGKLELEALDFNLEETLDKLAVSLAHTAAEKSLEFRIDPASEIPPMLIGDPVRLDQVLLNLLGNAIKFTQTGRVVLNVRLLEESLHSVRLEFAVRDTGIGISDEQQAQLFKPFSQADSSINRKYGGSGLGLTISQRLVRAMGGEISVASQPGQGSTFSFALTFERSAKENGQVMTQARSAQISPAQVLQTLRGGRILVVEDNAINRLVAKDMLKSLGLLAFMSASGEQALTMVQEEHFDAILMDIQMPGLDGYQTTAHIRSHPGLNPRAIPIIAMTANAQDSDRRKALEAGLNDYLAKPINLTQLANVLARWVKPAAPAPAPAPVPARTVQAGQADLPESLAAIDMVSALARLGDNRKLYRRVLLLFESEHGRDIEKIRAAMQASDWELARRLAHSLKGLAGTLGADELYAAARTLETAFAGADSPAFEPALADVEQCLGVVLGAIATLDKTPA